jgi:hypothetical protein
LVTYPTDLCKTKMQLLPAGTTSSSNLSIGQKGKVAQPSLYQTITNINQTQGFKGFYAGATSVIIGNSLKSCVRFASYERIKEGLRGSDVSRKKELGWWRG